jgi:hypothetical protein
MLKDLLQLDIDQELFSLHSIIDMEFINSVLEIMAEKYLANLKILDREAEADNLLDAEWQFSQFLNEISNNTRHYSNASSQESQIWIEKFKKAGLKRKRQIEESYEPTEQSMAEPVVTHAELNGLLGQL